MTHLVMRRFHQVEDHLSVGDIDGRPSQLFVKGGVMQQIKVLQQEQTRRLIIRIERKKAPEIVKGLAVEQFRLFNELRYVHICLDNRIMNDERVIYQLATVALKICSVKSLHICVTSSSCTLFRLFVVS